MSVIDLVAGTIVAKPCLSLARVLARSFQAVHPGVPFFVLLADEVGGCFDPATEPFRLVRLDDLDIPAIERFRFHYTQQPLSYAATPYLLAHLLDAGAKRVVFFKQESLVLGDHSSFFDLLARHSIVLTPHLVAPLDGPDRLARELNILQSGIFNAGLLGVADSPATRLFLRWWQDRLHADCRHSVPEGIHYEQRWLDLVPGFFEGVHVLRDPAYNVGHWNLPERAVQVRHGRVFAGDRPCALFRFSGYRPEAPHTPTRYSPRLTWGNIGPARVVFERFRAALDAEGYGETSRWPYAYASFDNGVSIADTVRAIYRQLGDAVAAFGDPLRTAGDGSFFGWLNEPADGETDASRRVTRLWAAIHRARHDLQAAFPDVLGTDRERFLAWTVSYGLREHELTEAFVPGPQP
jgi:hypothetical protein